MLDKKILLDKQVFKYIFFKNLVTFLLLCVRLIKILLDITFIVVTAHTLIEYEYRNHELCTNKKLKIY